MTTPNAAIYQKVCLILLALIGIPATVYLQPCEELPFPGLQVIPDDDTLNKVMIVVNWPDPGDNTNYCYPRILEPFAPDTDGTPGDGSISDGDDFSGDTGSADSNTADNQADQPTVIPRWMYYFETGDGTYYLINRDTIYHTYPDAGEYNMTMQLTPTYSPNRRPPRRNKKVRISAAGSSAAFPASSAAADPGARIVPSERISNFSPDDTNRIKIDPHLNAVSPGDTIFLAISYRNLDTSNPESGILDVVLPSSGCTVHQIRRANEPNQTDELNSVKEGQEVFHESIPTAQLWRWQYNNLQPQAERTVFLELVLSPDYVDANLPIYYGFGTQDGPANDKQLNFLCITGLGFLLPQSLKGDLQCSVSSPLVNHQTSNNVSMQVRRSRDPNFVQPNPAYLLDGEQDIWFDFTTFFQNLGDAPVKKVEITHYIDQLLAHRSLTSDPKPVLNYTDRIINNMVAFDTPSSPNTTLSPLWRLQAAGNWEYFLAYPEIDPTQDSLYTKGNIGYNLPTLPGQPMQAGDTLFASVLIEMDGSPLHSDTVPIPVLERPKYALPWNVGIKFGLNDTETFNWADFSLFHAGLVLRKPLQRMEASRYSYHNRRISVARLPEFWYQAELLYNQLDVMNPNISGGGSQVYHSIDLVPLQLRYTPNLFKKFVGISLGATASYLLKVEENQQELTMPDSFTDRLEAYWFYDLAIGNVVGKPGLSLGYRNNRLFTGSVLNLKDMNFSFHQLYLQLMF